MGSHLSSSTHLFPHMLNMYNESLELGALPQSLREASQDPSHCESYRPISLLNVDVKIFAKVLALRLERFLPQIISPDQTGFIKNRFSFFNIRRLLNIIYHDSDRTIPELIMSMNADRLWVRVRVRG